MLCATRHMTVGCRLQLSSVIGHRSPVIGHPQVCCVSVCALAVVMRAGVNTGSCITGDSDCDGDAGVASAALLVRAMAPSLSVRQWSDTRRAVVGVAWDGTG